MSVNEEFLSEHTIAMRKAAVECQLLLAPFQRDGTSSSSSTTSWVVDLLPELANDRTSSTSASLNERRNKVLTKWKDERHEDNLKAIRYDPNAESSPSSTWNFRRQFHQNNQPCRIHGLKESCFRHVNSIWSSPRVFRQWMRRVYPPYGNNDDGGGGYSYNLPVRRSSTHETTLDADGRAAECITINMPLEEYITYLDRQNAHRSNGETKDYLKDWHLEAFLEDHKLLDSDLYQVPDIFEHDLLNPFLRAFTKGDYRFVYWGPAGSRTDWHSDVLNSFSWSYNVYGCKEWTFLVPNSNRRQIIVQKAGECIFVPATWKHQVVNLEETLSVNRNWLTASNLDLCWNCLTTEIQSIEKELASWGSHYDWDARESMLRGCVGLDVTAFYLVILYRLATIEKEVTSVADRRKLLGPDAAFEVSRCVDTMQTILNEESLRLEERLAATLASAEMAQAVLRLGRLVFKKIHVSS